MTRVIVFIDNSNVFKLLDSLQELNPDMWCKQYNPLVLAEKLAGDRQLERVMFYCTPPPQDLLRREPEKYSAQNRYYEKVAKLPKVEVKFGTLKNIDGNLNEKNLDTQLTANMITMASANRYDHAIIVSNDGDFVSAVEGAKEQGKKVEVGHFKMRVSMDLKKSADITRRLRPSYFVHIDNDSTGGK